MKISEYSDYYGKTPTELSEGDLRHLTRYFQLLSYVEKPLASLLIPVYRAKETLMAHMFSLSHLKTILPYEVIFIDNNADSGTREILHVVGAKVVHEKEQGITHARQKGLEEARGEIILTMDPDSIYDPYYIDKMVLPFFKDSKLVCCYSISKSYMGKFQLNHKMQFRNRLKVLYFRWKLAGAFINRIKYVRAVAMAYRRDVFISVGYSIDLKAVSGCDDGMVAIQLNNLGKFKYIPVSVYTALPPPREAGKPFPFCNDRFIPDAHTIEKTIKELEIENAR